MHPAIIIGIVRSLIVDVAMGQIPRSTERISSFKYEVDALDYCDCIATADGLRNLSLCAHDWALDLRVWRQW